jgi:hypothetical protein
MQRLSKHVLTHAPRNNTIEVFSLCPRTDRCFDTRAQRTSARWRHTIVGCHHVTCFLWYLSVSGLYNASVFAAEIRLVEYSSKLEEYRKVQEVSIWRLNVWFEDFMSAEVQWYLQCEGYSSSVKIRCQETDYENTVKEWPMLGAVTKTSDSRMRSNVECFVVWKSVTMLHLFVVTTCECSINRFIESGARYYQSRKHLTRDSTVLNVIQIC